MRSFEVVARLYCEFIAFVEAITGALRESEPTSWALYRDDAGSDVDLNILRDLELLLGIDVQHLEEPLAVDIWRDLKVVKSVSSAKEIRGSCESAR